jgi:hypothetical protein
MNGRDSRRRRTAASNEPPATPEPGGRWSKLVDATRRINATGTISRGDMIELAEGYELSHTPEKVDWAAFCRAASRAYRFE